MTAAGFVYKREFIVLTGKLVSYVITGWRLPYPEVIFGAEISILILLFLVDHCRIVLGRAQMILMIAQYSHRFLTQLGKAT
jgi:hypothetical protein